MTAVEIVSLIINIVMLVLGSVLVIDAWLDGFFRDKVKRWLSDLQGND